MARVATPTPTQSMPAPSAVAHEKIAQRAYERWLKRGRPHGTDMVDWLEAEKELRAEMSRTAGPAPARR